MWHGCTEYKEKGKSESKKRTHKCAHTQDEGRQLIHMTRCDAAQLTSRVYYNHKV